MSKASFVVFMLVTGMRLSSGQEAASDASNSSKCKWSASNDKCKFDQTKYATSSVEGKWKNWTEFLKTKATCEASADQGSCDQSSCTWMVAEGKCQATNEYMETSMIYDDLSGCDAMYVVFLSATKPCKSYEAKDSCEAAPCQWTENTDYNANSVTTNYQYWDEQERCVATPSSLPGRCADGALSAQQCGLQFSNATKFEQNISFNPLYGVIMCKYVWEFADADNKTSELQVCMRKHGACDGMVTDAQLALVGKMFNDSEYLSAEEDDSVQAQLKACYAEKFCATYAELVVNGERYANMSWKLECGGGNATTCEAMTGCVWALEDQRCRSVKELRGDVGAISMGDSTCILTKAQELDGKAGLTDAEVVEMYKENVAKHVICNDFNVEGSASASCTAANNCKVKSTTDYRCDANGTVIAEPATTRCEYDDKAQMNQTEKEAAEMAKMAVYFDADTIKNAGPVMLSCEVLDNKTSCDGAVMTASEKNKMKDAAVPPTTTVPTTTAATLAGGGVASGVCTPSRVAEASIVALILAVSVSTLS